jgi:hypothetical protein
MPVPSWRSSVALFDHPTRMSSAPKPRPQSKCVVREPYLSRSLQRSCTNYRSTPLSNNPAQRRHAPGNERALVRHGNDRLRTVGAELTDPCPGTAGAPFLRGVGSSSPESEGLRSTWSPERFRMGSSRRTSPLGCLPPNVSVRPSAPLENPFYSPRCSLRPESMRSAATESLPESGATGSTCTVGDMSIDRIVPESNSRWLVAQTG